MATQLAKHVLTRCLGIGFIFFAGLFCLCFGLWLYQELDTGNTKLSIQRTNSFALYNVNVRTMQQNELLTKQAIIVRDGKIAAIQPGTAPLPKDLRHVDGNGGTVMPGLIDMHVHFLDRSYAKAALASGVTSMRSMGGFAYQLKWRDELNDGLWYGSNPILSSPIINSSAQGDPLAHFRVDDPNVARDAVNRFVQQGYDFIKVYEGLNAEVYQAVLDEARKLDVFVAGHPSYDLLDKAPEWHRYLRTFEHSEEIYDGFLQQTFDDDKVIAAAKFLRDNSITLIPTLAVNRELTRLSTEKERYLATTDQAGINPFIHLIYQNTSFARWLSASAELGEYNLRVDRYLGHITQLMHQQGVPLAIGSDAGALTGLPGQATIDEIELWIESGISAFDALKGATVNAAQALGLGKRLGVIASGYDADLILLREDPVISPSTLRQPSLVAQQGVLFDVADIQQLQREAHQHSNLVLSVVRHVSYLIFD